MAGARIFEVTFDEPAAGEGLKASAERLARRSDGPFLVGAGTIRTGDQLRAATDAGAAFAVSPTFNRELVEAALTARLPFIPGAATPTEVEAAWQSGATFVKLFPASSLGPSLYANCAARCGRSRRFRRGESTQPTRCNSWTPGGRDRYRIRAVEGKPGSAAQPGRSRRSQWLGRACNVATASSVVSEAGARLPPLP